MKFLKVLASFLVAALMLVVGLYFAVALCIAFFLLTGRLRAGEPMYMDMGTPSWPVLLAYLLASAAVLALGFYVRRKLGPPQNPP